MYHPFKGTQWACLGSNKQTSNFRTARSHPSRSLHLSCQLKQIFNVWFFMPLNRPLEQLGNTHTPSTIAERPRCQTSQSQEVPSEGSWSFAPWAGLETPVGRSTNQHLFMPGQDQPPEPGYEDGLSCSLSSRGRSTCFFFLIKAPTPSVPELGKNQCEGVTHTFKSQLGLSCWKRREKCKRT